MHSITARWFGSPVSAFGRKIVAPLTAPYTLIELAPPVSGARTTLSRLTPPRAESRDLPTRARTRAERGSSARPRSRRRRRTTSEPSPTSRRTASRGEERRPPSRCEPEQDICQLLDTRAAAEALAVGRRQRRAVE